MRKVTPGNRLAVRRLRAWAGRGILTVLGAGGDEDSPTEPLPPETWTSSGFSTASLGDGWTSDGVVWSAPFSESSVGASRLEYLKIGDVVSLRGGAVPEEYLQRGQAIAMLPAHCRPQGTYFPRLLCATCGKPGSYPGGYCGTAGVVIGSDGVIRLQTLQDFASVQVGLFFGNQGFSSDLGSGECTDAGLTWTAPYSAGVSPGSTLEYLVSGDFALLAVLANAGGTRVAVGQTVFTLPAVCRPSAGESACLLCPTWGWPSGHGEGYIGTAGAAVLPDGTCIARALKQYDGQQQFLHFDGKIISTTH